MKIILIRHGKPDIDTSGKVSSSCFGTWVEQYDKAGIHPESKPSQDLISRINESPYVVCSNLLRSIESAKFLGIIDPHLISPQFRECEMPYAKWSFPKFSKGTWSVLFRLLQFFGYSSNSESYNEIKIRAFQCAEHLQELCKTHKSVTFVGHGAINYCIHKQLIALGWLGPKRATRKNWDCAIYKYKI